MEEAEEEAAASASRQAEKELEEEGKKLLSLEDSLKNAITEQHAKERGLCDILFLYYRLMSPVSCASLELMLRLLKSMKN